MTTLKPRLNQVVIFSSTLLLSFAAMFFLIDMAINRNLQDFETILVLVIIILILPVQYLGITYFYADLNKIVGIDKEKRQIVIEEKGRILNISKKDVLQSFVVEGDWWGRKIDFRSFKYVMLILKERERVCITSLLEDPYKIITFLNLKPTKIEKFLPFIDWKLGKAILTSEEFDEKVKEFEVNLQNHSEKDLNNIILQKGKYANSAIEAAKRLLRKRDKLPNMLC